MSTTLKPLHIRLAKYASLALLAVLWQGSAMAQVTPQGQLPLVIGSGSGAANYSVPIQTLLFFTALSFLPAVLLMMTGFTRIVIVLSLLRQALGTQSAPPNQVIIGLSLFLTLSARWHLGGAWQVWQTAQSQIGAFAWP